MRTLQDLMSTLPQTGVVDWIGVRPGRREPVRSVGAVIAETASGLRGDRYSKAGGKRQVTLVQAEHLDAIASILKRDSVDPALLRRNVVVRGINLLALKDKCFAVGDAILEYTGLCEPCSHMETAFGPGGYNAVRGHGGITATIVRNGEIRIGSTVAVVPNEG